MTALWQLARARQLPAVLAGFLLVVVAGVIARPQEVRGGLDDAVHVPVVVIVVPVLLACLTALTTVTAVPELEGTSPRRVTIFRALLLSTLLLAGVGAVAVLAEGLHGARTESAAIRNFVGLTGLALMSTGFLGNSLGWLPPPVYAIAALFAGVRPDETALWWAWPVAFDDVLSARAWAIAFAVVGVAVSLTSQARRLPGRPEDAA